MDKLTLVIEKHSDGIPDVSYYMVTSPDLQGFVTEGETIQEALAMAIDCYECLSEDANPQWSLELAELLRAMRGEETYTKRVDRITEKMIENGDKLIKLLDEGGEEDA